MVRLLANRNRGQAVLAISPLTAHRTICRRLHPYGASGSPDSGDAGCDPVQTVVLPPSSVSYGIVPEAAASVSGDLPEPRPPVSADSTNSRTTRWIALAMLA